MIEKAPAKLTLTLRVLDKREDGFNNLSALTVFLPDIFDSLHLNSSGDFEIASEHIAMSADDTNLVVRAFQLFSTHAKVVELALDVDSCGFVLDKHIPIAAGLGGGSADAAATLRLLNRHFNNVLTDQDLHDIAAWLGSDIPGCLNSKALWMKGRGEIVEPVKNFEAKDKQVLAITPNIFCPTPLIYKRYEQMGRPTDVGTSIDGLSDHTDNIHNDLSIAAYDLFPNLLEFKSHVESITDLQFNLAGSGSTIFAISESDRIESAIARAKKALDQDDIRLIDTSSIV